MDLSEFVCILYHTRHEIKYGIITFNLTMYVNNFLKRNNSKVTFSFWTSRKLKPVFTELLWNEALTLIPVLRYQWTSRNIEGHSCFIYATSLKVHYLWLFTLKSHITKPEKMYRIVKSYTIHWNLQDRNCNGPNVFSYKQVSYNTGTWGLDPRESGSSAL
jgi:hypothetical protein